MNNCRACSHGSLTKVLDLKRVPKDVQRLLKKKELGKKHDTDFTVYQCSSCGLTQAPMQLSDDYYDDYYMSQTFSPQLTKYLDELVQQFIDDYAPNRQQVIDIGCGDGAFMEPFKKRDIKVVGIEPSARGRELAQQQGYTVYDGYVTADTVLPGAPYDTFVTRQVLEHVDDLSGFLTGIRNNLTPDAFGIIEVPRLEKALADNRFYDFFPDHVNYFTTDTLRTVLELHGFSVLGLGSVMHDEYNVAFVQVRQSLPFNLVKKQRTSLIKQLERLMEREQNDGVAIWGAGAKGLSIMSNMKTLHLSAVVDSDQNKIGRYTPVSEMLIQDPKILIKKKIGTVVISAVAYQQAILQKLRDMKYPGTVMLIGATGLEKVELQ